MKTINIDDRLYERIKAFCKENNLVMNRKVETVLNVWITVIEQESQKGDTPAMKKVKREFKKDTK